MAEDASRNMKSKLLLAGLVGLSIAGIMGGVYISRQSSDDAAAMPGTTPSRSISTPAGISATPLASPGTGVMPSPTGAQAVQPQDAVEETVVRLAKQDIAARQGIAEANITVTAIEQVEWNDSSLGCPQPGQMYLQVITPGYRIMLKAGGFLYEYHSDRSKRVVFCSSKAA